MSETSAIVPTALTDQELEDLAQNARSRIKSYERQLSAISDERQRREARHLITEADLVAGAVFYFEGRASQRRLVVSTAGILAIVEKAPYIFVDSAGMATHCTRANEPMERTLAELNSMYTKEPRS